MSAKGGVRSKSRLERSRSSSRLSRGRRCPLIEHEDLVAVGLGQLVEDGLRGLGRGAAILDAVTAGELADEAEGPAGAEGGVDETGAARVELAGEGAEQGRFAEARLGGEEGGGLALDGE
jgi:hypothetical protein